MKSQPKYHFYSSEELLQDLLLVIDENELNPIHANRAKRDLERQHRKHGLHLPKNAGKQWMWRLCAASLMRGKFHWTGWEYRDEMSWALTSRQWQYPRWNGEPCRLFVVAEQGIGDEILFLESLSDLLQDNPEVTYEVDGRLIPICENTWPTVKFVNRWKGGDNVRKKPTPLNVPRGDHDAFILAGNLPKLYRRERSDFLRKAFLRPTEADVAHWQEYLSGFDRPRVGLGTVGRLAKVTHDAVMYRGGTYFNLNYNGIIIDGAVEPPVGNDLASEIAFISCLDRVHCTTMAVAHEAGSVATECHVIKPQPVYGEPNNRLRWYYPRNRRQSYFYGNMIVYQSEADWLTSRREWVTTIPGYRRDDSQGLGPPMSMD